MEKVYFYKLLDFPEEKFSLDIKCDIPIGLVFEEKQENSKKGSISFDFEITGKRAKKIMKKLERLKPKKLTPFQYYGVRYNNLCLSQKVMYKRLMMPNFNPKNYE